MSMTRHHRDRLALSAPEAWTVDAHDGLPEQALAVTALAGPSGHRTRVDVALEPAPGDGEDLDAAALEAFLARFDRPLLVDLEVTEVAGAAAHRALVAADVGGFAVTVERWWRRAGDRLLTVTAEVETGAFATARPQLLDVVTSVEVEDG